MKPLHLTISEEVRDNIDIPDNKDINIWVGIYEDLNLTEKLEFIRHLEKMQSLYIRYAMEREINPIPLVGLGKFFYKQSRKEYYDIKNSNPDLSNDDIVKEVKDNYHKRKAVGLVNPVVKNKANVKKATESNKNKAIMFKLKK